MKLKAFSIHDDKSGAFMAPFFFPAVGQAVRAFADAANDDSSMIGKHPGDFVLWCLGIFDDSSGGFESIEPERLGSASEYKEVNGKVVGMSDRKAV